MTAVDVEPKHGTSGEVELLIPEARARARRRQRRLGAVFVLLVVAGAAVIAAWGASTFGVHGRRPLSRPGSSATNGRAVLDVATGTIYSWNGSPPVLCEALLLSMPPGGCSPGLAIRGIWLADVPSIATIGKTTFSRRPVTVYGVYTPGVMTASRMTVAARRTDFPAGPPPLSCRAPVGGWGTRPTQRDIAAGFAYDSRHPATSGGLWVTDDQRVLTIATTGSPADVARSLVGTVHSALCVVHVRFTELHLGDVINQLAPITTAGAGSDLERNRVLIGVTALDEPTRKYLARFPAGEVVATPTVTVAGH